MVDAQTPPPAGALQSPALVQAQASLAANQAQLVQMQAQLGMPLPGMDAMQAQQKRQATQTAIGVLEHDITNLKSQIALLQTPLVGGGGVSYDRAYWQQQLATNRPQAELQLAQMGVNPYPFATEEGFAQEKRIAGILGWGGAFPASARLSQFNPIGGDPTRPGISYEQFKAQVISPQAMSLNEVPGVSIPLDTSYGRESWVANPAQTGGSGGVSKYVSDVGQAWTVAPGMIGSYYQEGVVAGVRPTLIIGGLDTGIPMDAGVLLTAKASAIASEYGGSIFYGQNNTSNTADLGLVNTLVSSVYAPGTTPGNPARYGSPSWYGNEGTLREGIAMLNDPGLRLPTPEAGVYYQRAGMGEKKVSGDLVYGATGEYSIFQKTYDPETGLPRNYEVAVAGGGRNALQGGGLSLTSFYPTPDARYQAIVAAHPDLFARPGAEMYGGMVLPLGMRFAAGAEVGQYPAAAGNLAGLVNPYAVNAGREALPSVNIPGTMQTDMMGYGVLQMTRGGTGNQPTYEVMGAVGKPAAQPAIQVGVGVGTPTEIVSVVTLPSGQKIFNTASGVLATGGGFAYGLPTEQAEPYNVSGQPVPESSAWYKFLDVFTAKTPLTPSWSSEANPIVGIPAVLSRADPYLSKAILNIAQPSGLPGEITLKQYLESPEGKTSFFGGLVTPIIKTPVTTAGLVSATYAVGGITGAVASDLVPVLSPIIEAAPGGATFIQSFAPSTQLVFGGLAAGSIGYDVYRTPEAQRPAVLGKDITTTALEFGAFGYGFAGTYNPTQPVSYARQAYNALPDIAQNPIRFPEGYGAGAEVRATPELIAQQQVRPRGYGQETVLKEEVPTLDLREAVDLTNMRPESVATPAEQAMIMRQYALTSTEISVAKARGLSLNDILAARANPEIASVYGFQEVNTELQLRNMLAARTIQIPESMLIQAFTMPQVQMAQPITMRGSVVFGTQAIMGSNLIQRMYATPLSMQYQQQALPQPNDQRLGGVSLFGPDDVGATARLVTVGGALTPKEKVEEQRASALISIPASALTQYQFQGTIRIPAQETRQEQGVGLIPASGTGFTPTFTPFVPAIPVPPNPFTGGGPPEMPTPPGPGPFIPVFPSWPSQPPGGGGGRKRIAAFKETFMMGLDLSIGRPRKVKAKSFTSPKYPKNIFGKKTKRRKKK